LQLKIAKRQGLLKGQEAGFMWHYWWKDRVFFISAKSIFASTVHKWGNPLLFLQFCNFLF
jgi:hypothetical protein